MAVHTPLQSSGAISLSELQTEFGGSNPVSMSEYYRDASYTNHDGTGVPNLTVNSDIPNSGAVGMDDFHATVGSVTVTIASNNTGSWNLRTILENSPYSWDGSSPIAIYLIINSGVTLAASATSHYALDCVLHSTSMLTIINNGVIIGKGGAGGAGGVASGSPIGGSAGGAGGGAIRVQTIGAGCVITNNNLIGGGGGGGGGHGSSRGCGSSLDNENNCSGGDNYAGAAGGAGRGPNAAGSGGGNYGVAGSAGGGGGCSGCSTSAGAGGAAGAAGAAIYRPGISSFTLNGTASHSYNGTNGIGGSNSG